MVTDRKSSGRRKLFFFVARLSYTTENVKNTVLQVPGGRFFKGFLRFSWRRYFLEVPKNPGDSGHPRDPGPNRGDPADPEDLGDPGDPGEM